MDFETCTKPEDSSFESIYCRLVFSVIRQFYMYVLLRVTKVKLAFSSSAAKKYIKACAGKYWLNLWLCFHVHRNSETCTANTNNRLSCWTGVWHMLFSHWKLSVLWLLTEILCASSVFHQFHIVRLYLWWILSIFVDQNCSPTKMSNVYLCHLLH